MGKGEKQAEVAEQMKELHKQYGHNKTTCQHVLRDFLLSWNSI
jgi:hypothetical protein